jgi:hypothetical protein
MLFFYIYVSETKIWKSIVGSVVIDAKFDRNDHNSISQNCDQNETEIT